MFLGPGKFLVEFRRHARYFRDSENFGVKLRHARILEEDLCVGQQSAMCFVSRSRLRTLGQAQVWCRGHCD